MSVKKKYLLYKNLISKVVEALVLLKLRRCDCDFSGELSLERDARVTGFNNLTSDI